MLENTIAMAAKLSNEEGKNPHKLFKCNKMFDFGSLQIWHKILLSFESISMTVSSSLLCQVQNEKICDMFIILIKAGHITLALY